jgi:competence protein ComEA
MTPFEKKTVLFVLVFMTLGYCAKWLQNQEPNELIVTAMVYSSSIVESSSSEIKLSAASLPKKIKQQNVAGKINVNVATARELEKIPGIGPKTAIKIIQFRKINPFQSLRDLKKVKGIGDKKLKKMLSHITF